MDKVTLLFIFLAALLSACEKNPIQGGASVLGNNPPIDYVTFDSPSNILFVNFSSYPLSGACSSDGQNVDLNVGGITTSTPCSLGLWSTSIDTSSLVDGPIVITADHYDGLGNSIEQISTNVVKDIVIPTVSILSALNINIANSLNYTVSGSCSETGRAIGVSIGGITTSPICDSFGFWTTNATNVSSLADGSVNISADHDDDAGNNAVQSTITVNKDATAPTVTITSPSHINIANASAYTLSGTCSENGETVNVDIAGIALTPTCTTSTWTTGSIDVSSLSDGSVNITADHDDTAGNSATQATTSITKDVIIATVSITSADNITVTNVTNYIISGACSENGETVNVDIGGIALTPTCTAATWSTTATNVTTLPDGPVDITADHSDVVGNNAIQATVSVTKDATPPTVTITSPSDINISNATSYSLIGTCSENGRAVNLDIGGITVAPNCSAGSWSAPPINISSLSDGTVTITADHDDSIGNNAVQASHDVLKDTVAPTVSITSADNIIISNQLVYSVSGACSEEGQAVSIDIQGISLSPNCSSWTWTTAVTDVSSLANGTVTITADIFDNAGNSATQASVDVSKSTVVPTVTITSADDIDASNVSSYTASGTCSEDGEDVSINIESISVTPTCSSGAWSISPTDVSALTDGTVTITADHADSLGNNAVQASIDVNKDVTTPTVSINFAPDINQSNETSYFIYGGCSQNGSVVTIDIGGLSFSPNCTSGTWDTGFIDVSSLTDDPAILITADHSTATQATTNVAKDTSSAVVTISSAPDINLSNETSYIASGTCTDDGVNVPISIGALSFTPVCSGTTWTTGSIDVSSLADNPSILFTADHSTATQATTTISKNTGTPTISSLSVASTLKASADISWTLNNPSASTINDHQINYRVQGDTTWLSFDDGINIEEYSTVTGLTSSTNYEFRVRVQYDTSNFSDWSNIATGETKPDNPIFDSEYATMNVGGSTSTTIVSYEDNTNVTLNGVAIAASPMSKGQTTTITTAQFDIMDADKPIYVAGLRSVGAGAGANANITWAPNSWGGKSFSFNAIRTNNQALFVYATEDSVITVKNGSTTLASATVTAGNGTTLTWAFYGSYQVISTGTILAYHISIGSGTSLHDPKPLLPGHTEMIGFPSSSMRITASFDSTNYSLIHSDSTVDTGSLSKTDSITVNPEGTSSLYQSESLLITADKKISGASFADSNGLCAAPFIPTNLLKTKYAINVASDYVAFASKSAGSIDVYSPGQTVGVDTPVETLTLTSSGANPNAPYRVRRAATPAGYRFISTVAIAGWYQPSTDTGGAADDETILYGTND